MTAIKRVMKHKATFLAVLIAVVIGISGVMYTPAAYAWDGSTEGNNEESNSQEVGKDATGQTSVEGWIGTFDGTEDPNRPNPPANDWINVTIPVKALFGSLETDEGDIYSPQYHIYNNSVRDVNITPAQFAAVETEPDALSGMTLNLDFSSPEKIFTLRNTNDEFLGNGINADQKILLGKKVDDVVLSADFTINGSLPGNFVYPSTEAGPYQPAYKLTFTFESVTPQP